jgi:poly-gamma-glutamate capsule biosynthesis protein CapA/YwtB (metallophosphatase superfamily)
MRQLNPLGNSNEHSHFGRARYDRHLGQTALSTVGFAALVACLMASGCNSSTTSQNEHANPTVSATSLATSPSPPASAPSPSRVAPAKPLPLTITLSAVGDCTFGGGIENGFDTTPFDHMMTRHKDDPTYPFSGVLDIFRNDDITIVNLEGTLTTSTEPIPQGKFHFRGKPEYARILKESSVEIANVANNHMGDFGLRGQQDTSLALTNAGVGVSGNGIVDVRTIRGIEVVNVGFTGVHMTRTKVKSEIEARKKPDNLVIASFHWGMEGTHEVIDIQRDFGRQAIDAGADVVLGHHPHVVQAMETYQGKHIVHSLGNFVFGANTNPQKIESMIYRETFVQQDGRMIPKSFDVIPVLLCARLPCLEFRPVPLEGNAKLKFLAWFHAENEKLEKRPFDEKPKGASPVLSPDPHHL